MWAALAGLGAASLLLGLATALLMLLWRGGILVFSSAPGFTAAYAPALLFGVVVARSLGGWRAVLGVAALGAVALTRLFVFIDSETLFAYSAIPMGLVLGAALSAVLGRVRVPYRAALEAAGVMGLIALPLHLLDTAARLSTLSDPYPVSLALSIVGVLAAAITLANRSREPMRDAVLLAGVLLAIGLLSLPGVSDDPRNVAGAVVRYAGPVLLVGATWLATRTRQAVT